MTNTIDAGELLHIAEREEIVKHIEALLSEHDDTDGTLTISYRTKLKETAETLGMDAWDRNNFVFELESDYDLEDTLGKFDQYTSVYDLAMAIAAQLYVAEEAEKKAAEAKKIADDLAAAAKAAIAPTPAPTGPILGVLLLPSLETHGRFIALHDISVEEAKTITRDFTAHTVSKRKVKNFDPANDIVDDIEFFHNVIDFSEMKITSDSVAASLEAELQSLKVSDTRGVRGLRPLFVSKAGVIGVGTTVIYNPNWATKNFSDPDMWDTLQEIQDSFN